MKHKEKSTLVQLAPWFVLSLMLVLVAFGKLPITVLGLAFLFLLF